MADQKLSRRKMILVGGAGLAAASVFGRAAAATGETKADASPMQKLPWAYKTPLDPNAAGDRGFAGYAKGHCMYGSFEAMVGAVADQLGAPYTSFPFDLMEYGAGGIAGWGTVCGALSGAAAAFKVLSPKPEPLIDALFAWYETEPLPDYVPKGVKFANVKSVAGSPLCHQSVSLWCKASGKKTYTAERKERCGVITAAVARKAVMLLNDQAAGKPLPVLSGSAKKCGGCHEKGGELENTRGKMSCSGCHSVLGAKHPVL
jgi:Putative redox-active protein (C_GCAxxG_C_C)